MNKIDFNFTADSNGYMIQYRGINIGGAGSLRGDRKRKPSQMAEDVKMYHQYAEIDIEQILKGAGKKYMVEAIERIEKNLITTVTV